MDALKKIYHGLYKMEVILAYVSGIAVLIMLFHNTADVIARNFFGYSFQGTYEMSMYVYQPLAVIPAIGFVYRAGVLPRVDLLFKKFKGKTRVIFILIMMVVEVLLFFLLGRYSLNMVAQQFARKIAFTAGGKYIYYYWVFLCVPIGFFVLTIEAFFSNLFEIIDPKERDAEKALEDYEQFEKDLEEYRHR